MVKIKKEEKKVGSIEKFAPRINPESELVEIKKPIAKEKINKNKKNTKRNFGKIAMLFGVSFVIVIFASLAFYFYHKYKTVSVVEGDEIVTRIGKFMELPQGEIPTLATVTDKDKMKDQPFFAKAENGDKVLIYTQAQKAILYRPSSHKVIEVMMLSINKAENPAPQPIAEQPAQTAVQNDESAQSAATEEKVILKVAIYNGTSIKGKASMLGDQIAKLDNIEIIKKSNAVGSFEKSLVIDLAGNKPEIAKRIADEIGGEIGAIPDGEAKPDADILVIGGKN